MRRRGTTTGPPDFVGVGAYLSGGAWWRRLLLQHPQIVRPPHGKWNVNFFQRFHDAPWEPHNHANYLTNFPRRPGEVAGEWSDRYAYHPWSVPLLLEAAPEVKLLYMVRDPVERFRRQAARNFSGERAGFPVYMAEAIHRGRYHSQLRQLEAVVDRERILVLQNEACRLDPLTEWRRTCRFLGVDEDFVPHGLDQVEGQVEEVRYQRLKRLLRRSLPEPLELWPDIESTLVREYREEVRRFAEAAPEVDVNLWPRFADGPPRRTAGGELPRPTRRRRRPFVLAGAGVTAASAAGLLLGDVI